MHTPPDLFDAAEFARDLSLSTIHLPLRVRQRMHLEEKERLEAAEPTDARWNPAPVARLPRSHQPIEPQQAIPPSKPRGHVRLFDERRAAQLLKAATAGHGAVERAQLMKKLAANLIDRGPFRRIAKPASSFPQTLEEILRRFPNAAELIEYLRFQAALARRRRGNIGFTPVCLVGPPGAGKSVLMESIAQALCTPMHRVQVEIANHASAIVGTESHWSTAAPGQLFDLLVEGDCINPIILLDELEKVQTRDDHPNLHKVLFGLLEPASARQFKDACVPQVPLDASWVRWVATANSLDGIPEPILSRMRVIEVPALTTEQARSVARNIDAETRKSYRLQALPELPAQAIELLARHSPRRMHQLTAEIYGRLLAEHRQTLTAADLRALEIAPRKPRPSQDSLSDLLSLTNLAAIRAVELNAQLPRMVLGTGYAPTFH